MSIRRLAKWLANLRKSKLGVTSLSPFEKNKPIISYWPHYDCRVSFCARDPRCFFPPSNTEAFAILLGPILFCFSSTAIEEFRCIDKTFASRLFDLLVRAYPLDGLEPALRFFGLLRSTPSISALTSFSNPSTFASIDSRTVWMNAS